MTMSVNITRNVNKKTGGMYTRIGLKNRAYKAFSSPYIRLAYVNGKLYFKESGPNDPDALKLSNNTGTTSIFTTFCDGTLKVPDKIIKVIKASTGEHELLFDPTTSSYYTTLGTDKSEQSFADKVNELCKGEPMVAETPTAVNNTGTDIDIAPRLKALALELLASDRTDDAVIIAKAAKICEMEALV